MRNKTRHTQIMARYAFITICILIFAGIISFKLFSTTVVHRADWNKKANKELSVTDVIEPKRGSILADDGSVLATNLTFYNVRIDYRSEAFAEKDFLNNDTIKALCDSMARAFPQLSAKQWNDTLMKPMSADKEKRPRAYTLLKNITNEEVERLKTFPFFKRKNPNKTGLTVQDISRRVSCYGNMARRSIGNVTIQKNGIHGYSGLEKALDSLLYGIPGQYKRMPFTRKIGNWTDIPAVDGYDVKTTINITMQDLLEEELYAMLDSCGAEWGTAVLMEVESGDIKAIANLERDDKTGKYIEAYNRACVAYEPGSVVKTISMLIALEDGLINNLNEELEIGATYAYGGGNGFRDSHFIGRTTVAGVLEQSSNIGMTKIMTRNNSKYHQNPPAFVERLAEIGIFDKMNSGIAEEETPRMPRNPKRIDLARMCYGYTTAIPPLYTLSYYNAIANKGKYVRPRLVSQISRNGVDSMIPVSYIRERICSEENAEKLKYMLSRVVEGEHGTARILKDSRVRIAGKTGTCNNFDTITRQYVQSQQRLAFCGFFPTDAPKYSMIVLTFHPTKNMFGAARTSGMVVKNMAEKLYTRGFLEDYPNIKDVKEVNSVAPVFTASGSSSYDGLKKEIGDQKCKSYAKSSSKDENGVPLVLNFGLREAIARLESAGYEVKFRGEGHVVGQQLVAGKLVELTLSNAI